MPRLIELFIRYNNSSQCATTVSLLEQTTKTSHKYEYITMYHCIPNGHILLQQTITICYQVVSSQIKLRLSVIRLNLVKLTLSIF